MKNKKKVDLIICGITVVEAKEIMLKVRKLEQRDPERTIFIQVRGMENSSVEEAKEILKAIFPISRGGS